MNRPLVDYVVLDALANDLESLEDILRILNSDTELGWRDIHPDAFGRDEVVTAILRGIQDGNISPCEYSEAKGALVDREGNTLPADVPIDDLWFRLTPRGRTILNNWDVPEAGDAE
ncbi:MAG TPA: hypothetical protein VMM12_03435 [Longimicrobiales bacterium]|nr:hypothetical protein [Longimicrobiales bacterium]